MAMKEGFDFKGKEVVGGSGDRFKPSGGLDRELGRSCVKRDWGECVLIESGESYRVKRLTLDVGKKISLHRHLHRSENWVVVSGVARVVLGDDEIILRRNESACVPLGGVHRLENFGRIPLEVIEVQVGEYFGDDDVERFGETCGLGTTGGRWKMVDDLADGEVDMGSEEFCIGEGCGEE